MIQNFFNISTGTSAQAANIWPGPDDLYKWKWEQLTKYVVTSLGSFGPDISHEALRLYNVSERNGKFLNAALQTYFQGWLLFCRFLKLKLPHSYFIPVNKF